MDSNRGNKQTGRKRPRSSDNCELPISKRMGDLQIKVGAGQGLNLGNVPCLLNQSNASTSVQFPIASDVFDSNQQAVPTHSVPEIQYPYGFSPVHNRSQQSCAFAMQQSVPENQHLFHYAVGQNSQQIENYNSSAQSVSSSQFPPGTNCPFGYGNNQQLESYITPASAAASQYPFVYPPSQSNSSFIGNSPGSHSASGNQYLYNYQPELNAEQNPHYYQINQILFEAHMQRSQRVSRGNT